MSEVTVQQVEVFNRDPELEFIIEDENFKITVHPWDRDGQREVYITMQDYEDAHVASEIVERDKFVEGLLAVFPEITRKEGN